MKFSIVIPTYNRPGHVAELLEAWERVDYPKDDYELILADDGGSEPLDGVVGPWEGRVPVRLLRLEHVSASSARASGLAVAVGELVMCSDDDCRPDPGILRAYAEAAREHPGAALGGPVVNLLEDDVYATATQEMITFIGEEWNRVGACFFTFSSLVFPAGAFRANGGFDAGWLWRTGEDRDVCRRWCEGGGEMVPVPGAVMGHAHGLTLRKYWRQHFHYGQGNHASRRNRRNEAGAPDFSGVGFYWRLLTRPFRGYGFGRAVVLLGLILLAQVANLWGTLDAARRLVEGSEGTVLVIEAGGGYPGMVFGPPLAGMRLRGPWTWPVETVAQEQLGGRTVKYPMGRVVGGTSSVNAMIYNTGADADYDDWEAAGCRGWGGSVVREVFGRLAGTGGWLPVSGPRHRAEFSEAFLGACEGAGLRRRELVMGEEAETCGYFPVMQKDGRRAGAATECLGEVRGNSRLTVWKRAEVRRLVMSGTRVTGVELKDGRRVGGGEIVLSAGVFLSPVILQRSGIGDPGWLERCGVRVVAGLSGVGENLHDHVRVPVLYEAERRSPGRRSCWVPAAVRYLVRRDGVMVSNCCEAGAFFGSERGAARSDLEIITHFQTAMDVRAVDMECLLLRPESRGSVRMDPREVEGMPLVDAGFLRESGDVRRLVAGVERVREIAGVAGAWRGFPLRGEMLPGGGVRTAAGMEAYVRAEASTGYHPGGTCRMGEDEMAVTDSELRVRGVEGLRVVDASVMPSGPTGSTAGAVFMIAERAAEMMLGGK